MPISEVYNMDCMEYMKGIPDKFFDLAIVDPQYGIDIMHKGGMPKWQKDMAHWADRKEIYMSCDFKDFSPRKGFLCKEYFKIL